MRNMQRIGCVVMSVIVSMHEARAGKCASDATYEPRILTSEHRVTIGMERTEPPEQGLLIATIKKRSLDPSAGTWTFAIGDERSDAIRTEVAPGLYVFSSDKTGGKAKLLDPSGGNASILEVPLEAPTTKPLAAPAIKSITAVASTVGGGASRRTHTTVTVVLKKNVPEDAMALVVFSAGGTKQARSWGRPAADNADREVIVYESPGRCESSYPGELETTAGDKVTLAWLDRYGRLGKRTTTLVVRKGK